MNKELFESLPVEVKEDAKNTLKAFDKVTVIFQNGKYNVTTGTCLLNVYPEDFKVIGTVTKEEVYTDNDMIENYINEFMSYPVEYKGKKDWLMIKKMNEDKQFDWDNKVMHRWIGKLNNEGNFELTEKIEINI